MTASSESFRVRVRRKEALAEGIELFELESLHSSPLPAFSAGSHIDVHTPSGAVRQYSLCNDPADTHRYQIAVLREPAGRGGSAAMHDGVAAGDVLTISLPRNHFPLASAAGESLLLAGGIGITPLLCMAERLAALDAPFQLHYCTRSRERTAFHDRIRAAAYAPRVHFHFDDGDPAQRMDLAALLREPRADMHLYTCGPKGFMDAVLGTARGYGWPEAQLHYEFFSAEPQAKEGDSGFDVQLASSGKVIRVGAGETVIAALAAAGVEVPTSCEQGVCGTCLTRVLAGEPDHRDLYLTPEEQASNTVFLPCCSRSRSGKLVLDL